MSSAVFSTEFPRDAEILPTFVYGTLRPGQRNYERLLDGLTTSEQTATFTGGTMYDYSGFPFVVMDSQSAPNVVIGDLLTFADKNFAAVLSRLDRLESYYPGRDGMYDRMIVEVVTPDCKKIRAYTYIASKSSLPMVRQLPVISSGDWVQDGMYAEPPSTVA